MKSALRKTDPSATAIPKILLAVYRKEDLLTTSANLLGNGAAEVEFFFPDYRRTAEPMTHVSAVQIGAAILEGTYCALEDAVNSGRFPPGATIDWFYSVGRKNEWIILRQNILYRKMLLPGSNASLTFKLADLSAQRFRRNRLSITVEFDGFCSGENTWIIDPPRILN